MGTLLILLFIILAIFAVVAYEAGSSGKEQKKTGSRLMRRGSRGEDVAQIQKWLGIKVDGQFGPKTAAAVKTFQRSHKLAADGIVGPKTWAALTKGAKQ